MTDTPKLLLPPEYVHDATLAIGRAKKSVSFLCMMVADDEATDELIDALNAASLRGVEVKVAADVFTYGELSGHFIPTRYFSKKSRNTTKMAQEFKKSNVDFYWLGRFTNTPITGRTHIKWCIVDDVIYSFGGVNLYDQGLLHTDYMFRLHDEQLARTLNDEFDLLIRADRGRFSYRSHSFNSQQGTVYIDGGLPLDSIIYRRACALSSKATSVLYVSQYGPTGKLYRLLKRSDSQQYFNTGKNASLLSKMAITMTHFLTRNNTVYTRDRYIHAKFMIFTMPGGQKIALTGSHNFSHGGVLLGTREIALETSDEKIIEQLETFFAENVA